MKIFRCLSLFLFVLGAAVSARAEQATFTPEHLAAAERVVYAMALPERFILPTKGMIDLSKKKDPDNAGLMSATFALYLDKKYTAMQLKPFFADRFDLDTCRRIATFWEGPVGKKLVKTQIQLLTTGNADRPVYTRNEKSILKQFEMTAAGQAMLAAMPDIEDTLAEFTKDTQTKMREEFLRALEARVKSSS